MVLATAIPWSCGRRATTLGYGVEAADVAANGGLRAVGMVLGGLGVTRAAITAALMATLAETSQFVMMFRDPSLVDVASNVIGAVLGIVISVGWGIRVSGFRINRPRALTAAVLAVVLILAVRAMSGDALNARGSTAPGILEAHWKLDESSGRMAVDSSGHGLTADSVINRSASAVRRSHHVRRCDRPRSCHHSPRFGLSAV